jgi:hypothetical protein
MLIAQSLGEYGGGGGGIASGLATSVQNGARWLELSLREDHTLWVAAVVCVALFLVVTRRR